MQEVAVVHVEPSEFRKTLDRVNAAIKNLHHFTDMTKIMTQMLDGMDVSMLADEKALLLGRITADNYGMMMAMLGMHKTQLELMEQFWSKMGIEKSEQMVKIVGAAEKITSAETSQVLEGAMPEYLQAYMKKIEGKKFNEVLDETLVLLTDLNANVLSEFNPTLASTKYAIAYSLTKIFSLCRISDKEDPEQRMMELMKLVTAQLVESCEHIDQLFEREGQISEVAHLFTATQDLVQKITSKDSFVTEDFKEIDAAKLLISLIPLELALVEMLQVNEAKMLKVSCEFYEAVQFSQKLTADQMDKIMAASPKLIRLLLAAQNVQLVTLAWDLDPAGFFKHFFEITEGQEFQLLLLKTTFERTLLLAPDLVEGVLQLVDEYCAENVDSSGEKVLVELRQQFLPQIKAHEQRAAKVPLEELQRESFTDFLRLTMNPDQVRVVPSANAAAPNDEAETGCCCWSRGNSN
jgi:hypothetical protein